jgi:hypothetical protein
MYNVIQYFSTAKNIKPYWIFNKFIRETNRKANIYYINNFKSTRFISDNPLAYNAINKSLNLIEQNKKIVICSSVKSFTNLVFHTIHNRFPNKKINLYNSDTINSDEIIIDTSSWSDLDVLIYSPSITAGVSFEDLHFDSLVGYFVNSKYTPTIDITLQQLFRVRQLKNGDMFIYVLNQITSIDLPIFENDVEKLLDNDDNLVNKYYSTDINFYSQQIVNNNKLIYDKERLSYQILKGIILLYNRSYSFYIDILKNTLKQDYNISCQFIKNDSVISPEDSTFISEIDNKINDIIPSFSNDLIINELEYDFLFQFDNLTPIQKIQKRLFEISNNLYGIDSTKIDIDFYNNYVINNKSYDIVYALQRINRAINFKISDIQNEFSQKLDNIKLSNDPNIEIYKSKFISHYLKLITGVNLLNHLFDSTWKDNFKTIKKIHIYETYLSDSYNDFMSSLTSNQKKELFTLYDLKSTSKPFIAVKKILNTTFYIDINRRDTNPTRDAYKDLYINFNDISNIYIKYTPKILSFVSNIT